MTFQALYYFLTVYEECSITTAARRLFISQQCLSMHIQKLERICGTELFIRRPVFKATYAGDRLAAAARDILRIKKEILTELKEIRSGQTGKLNLGFSGILAREHLPYILTQFNSAYPGIEVTAVTSNSTQLEEQAVNGKIDFYVGTSGHHNSILTEIPLINVSLVVVVTEDVFRQYTACSSEQIATALHTGVTLEDISPIPLILPMRGWRVRDPIDSYIKAHNLRVKLVLEADQSIALSACLRGIGAAVLYSTTPVQNKFGMKNILKFPLKNINYSIRSSICYRFDHYLTEYEEELIHLIQNHFKNYVGTDMSSFTWNNLII